MDKPDDISTRIVKTAKLLGVSATNVRMWRYRGKIPADRKLDIFHASNGSISFEAMDAWAKGTA